MPYRKRKAGDRHALWSFQGKRAYPEGGCCSFGNLAVLCKQDRKKGPKSNEEKGVTKEQSLVNAFYEKTGKTM